MLLNTRLSMFFALCLAGSTALYAAAPQALCNVRGTAFSYVQTDFQDGATSENSIVVTVGEARKIEESFVKQRSLREVQKLAIPAVSAFLAAVDSVEFSKKLFFVYPSQDQSFAVELSFDVAEAESEVSDTACVSVVISGPWQKVPGHVLNLVKTCVLRESWLRLNYGTVGGSLATAVVTGAGVVAWMRRQPVAPGILQQGEHNFAAQQADLRARAIDHDVPGWEQGLPIEVCDIVNSVYELGAAQPNYLSFGGESRHLLVHSYKFRRADANIFAVMGEVFRSISGALGHGFTRKDWVLDSPAAVKGTAMLTLRSRSPLFLRIAVKVSNAYCSVEMDPQLEAYYDIHAPGALTPEQRKRNVFDAGGFRSWIVWRPGADRNGPLDRKTCFMIVDESHMNV